MHIYYFAAARAARGCVSEELTGSYATLADVVDALKGRGGSTESGMTLADVMHKCSFLVDGQAASLDTPVADAHRIDVLPPFAGG